MATDNNKYTPVTVAAETHISRPVYQEGLPVSWSDWDFVKDRINRCRVRLDIWGYAMSFFLSVFLFATAIAISDFHRIIFIVIAIASLLLAVVCVCARQHIKHVQGEGIKTVLEDMGQIEKRYQRPPSDSVNTKQDENETRSGNT